MKRGEVWWVEFDRSASTQTRKTCPAVIISNDAANRHLSRVVVVPLTSSTGRLYPGEALVMIGGQRSKAMSDQITAVAKPRLAGQLGTLSKADLRLVEDALSTHLGLPR